MKQVLTLLKWIALFVFAMIVLSLSPIAFVVNVFRLFWKRKVGKGIDRLNEDLRRVNYTLDMLGNVTLFKWIDHYTDRHQYGNYNETISFVLYNRYKENKLTWFDRFLYNTIKWLDKKHFEL